MYQCASGTMIRPSVHQSVRPYQLLVHFKVQHLLLHTYILNTSHVRPALSALQRHQVFKVQRSLMIHVKLPPPNCDLQYFRVRFIYGLNVCTVQNFNFGALSYATKWTNHRPIRALEIFVLNQTNPNALKRMRLYNIERFSCRFTKCTAPHIKVLHPHATQWPFYYVLIQCFPIHPFNPFTTHVTPPPLFASQCI